MSKRILKISWSVLLVLVILTVNLAGQCQNRILSAYEKKTIIDTYISTFRIYYIDPDVMSEMENAVRKKYSEGEYESISKLQELTYQIMKDFRAVSNDRHIWIDILDNLPVKDTNVSDREKVNEMRKSNFGFSEFEILPGNIAYLKLDAFVDYKYGKETAYGFMDRMSECDEIIFDLRNNHGGNENMVRFIASYFFEDKVQLNSLYFRFSDSLLTNWTDPGIARNKLINQKLFILTGENTSSAAESFTYVMKNYHRATIIGRKTRGAAHWKETYTIPDLGIFLEIPVARPINPVSGTDWEGTGIIPDIPVSEDKALEQALRIIRENNQLD